MGGKRDGRMSLVSFLAAISLLVGRMAYGYAQAGSALPAPTRTSSPGSMPTPSPDKVEHVSRELYCPLCTGVRLDTCDLPLCDQMREVIRQKLAAGETKEEIKAYFVEQYGQVVLGAPPKRGGMILTWVLPFLVMLMAGGWIYYIARRWTQRRASDGTEAPAPGSLPAEYVERLERELERFE